MAGCELNKEFKPLHNICEFLNALHVYADEARRGVVRHVEANHFCSHVRHDLRQCLIYDSAAPDARLIGVEYMVPKHIYDTFDAAEQKFWHSHEFEVSSGMLVLPKPEGKALEDWEKMELEAMKEVIGLYGKTWHFWQVDRGDQYPFGPPVLMGSIIKSLQVDLQDALQNRDKHFGIDHQDKAKKRQGLVGPGVHVNADSWWNEPGKAL